MGLLPVVTGGGLLFPCVGFGFGFGLEVQQEVTVPPPVVPVPSVLGKVRHFPESNPSPPNN